MRRRPGLTSLAGCGWETGASMSQATPQDTIHDGRRSSAYGLESQGFCNLKAVHWNQTVPALYEESLRRGEGLLAKDGPLVVLTGQHTGRSATDKFVVRDAA